MHWGIMVLLVGGMRPCKNPTVYHKVNIMQAITKNASAALKAANWPTTPATPHANTIFVLSKKGGTARPAVGNQNNAASWAGVLAVLAANNGKATGAQLMLGIIAHNPANIGNATGYLNYVQGGLGWLQAQA